MKYSGKIPTQKSNNNIEILTGENSDTEAAKKISDFVCKKANVERRYCSFLYNIMIELMSNTYKHAYNNSGDDVLDTKWYCFVKYDDQRQTLSFIFMDTGRGIPNSVKKKAIEKVQDKFLFYNRDNYKYVISALNGEYRTSTGLSHRGKGLPKIKEFCSNGKISNMRIITYEADVNINKYEMSGFDTKIPLRGTMYYWQINIHNMKG